MHIFGIFPILVSKIAIGAIYDEPDLRRPLLLSLAAHSILLEPYGYSEHDPTIVKSRASSDAPSRGSTSNQAGPRAPREHLQELRTYLHHFDRTGEVGESDTVAENKSRLRARILEVEAELARWDK